MLFVFNFSACETLLITSRNESTINSQVHDFFGAYSLGNGLTNGKNFWHGNGYYKNLYVWWFDTPPFGGPNKRIWIVRKQCLIFA